MFGEILFNEMSMRSSHSVIFHSSLDQNVEVFCAYSMFSFPVIEILITAVGWSEDGGSMLLYHETILDDGYYSASNQKQNQISY